MPVSSPVSERVERERHAADETELYDNVVRLHRRFGHVFRCPAVVEADARRERLYADLIPGATVLDYGCYDGTHELWRWRPRKLVGIDISEVAIARADELYGDKGAFHVADAHDLGAFADDSFDVIIGNGILHHLELEVAVREVRRLLRPGGSALFMEPLGDNPAAKLFRRFTPRARTADERPLDRASVTALDALFSESRHDFCSIVSTPVAALTSLTPLRPDNAALKACARLDGALARTPLKWWARAIYIHWVK